MEEWLETLEEWKQVEPMFCKWNSFMKTQVTFTLDDSEVHTQLHCSRVMIYALIIAQHQGLSEQDKEALATAAAFHDSRRQDDWLDVGHGQRAADYYKQYCDSNHMAFDERVYDIMAYHDLDDEVGKKVIADKKLEHAVALYEIFKDADALDRFRLAENGLDEKYLRTKEAKELVDFARDLVNNMLDIKKVENPNRYLIIVDMQNDFVSGSLGTKEAEEIVGRVAQKAESFAGNIIFTLDTHKENYMETQEGKILPVKHCIGGTEGWLPVKEIMEVHRKRNGSVYQKPTFASVKLAEDLRKINEKSPIEEIELVGLCTDVCVVSNALLLKAYMPEVSICVDKNCCAGITPQKHEAALQTMQSCHIIVRE